VRESRGRLHHVILINNVWGRAAQREQCGTLGVIKSGSREDRSFTVTSEGRCWETYLTGGSFSGGDVLACVCGGA
jgi:hypothetical protein